MYKEGQSTAGVGTAGAIIIFSLLHRVVLALVQEAERAGCYKVMLDCEQGNIGFYEKCGFQQKEVQMVRSFSLLDCAAFGGLEWLLMRPQTILGLFPGSNVLPCARL